MTKGEEVLNERQSQTKEKLRICENDYKEKQKMLEYAKERICPICGKILVNNEEVMIVSFIGVESFIINCPCGFHYCDDSREGAEATIRKTIAGGMAAEKIKKCLSILEAQYEKRFSVKITKRKIKKIMRDIKYIGPKYSEAPWWD